MEKEPENEQPRLPPSVHGGSQLNGICISFSDLIVSSHIRNMKKRLLSSAFLVVILLTQLVGYSQQINSNQPNFIIILADDLGFADLSMNGSLQIKTPNIDALAANGVNFTQGYVSSPVCSPSRTGILTGKNQVEFGYDNNLPQKTVKGVDPNYEGLALDQPTIAERLKKLGYTTGLIGKWHLGYQPQFHPTKRGFDEFWGYTAGGHDYFRSETDGNGYLAPLESNYKTPQKIGYLTDDKGDECVRFIDRHKGQSFFLFASFNAPHTPMQATEEDLKLYAHIKNEKRRTYAAMINRLDVNVGRIMNELERQGLRENTLVVFLSDNGDPVDTNASINAPYRGQKGILLEGGIHVPYIMHWPAGLDAGMVYNEPVSSLDIAATFFELAGGITNASEFTGVNLLPFITARKKAIPHHDLKWKFTISRAIRRGEWKLISVPDRMPMLYHLSSDTSELKDVSLDNPAKTQELLKSLGAWDVQLPYSTVLEAPMWKKRQLDLYDSKYLLFQPIKQSE